MNSSDFRAEAREKLSEKWGKAALITLAYFALILVINYIIKHSPESISSLLSLASYIINVPISFGLIICYVNLYKDIEVNLLDFITLGFSNFTKAWGVSIRVTLKLILPIIIYSVSYIMFALGIFETIFGAFEASRTVSYSFSKVAIIGLILFFISIICFS